MYKVTVTKKHCIDSNYLDVLDCPLFRAISEQLPDLGVEMVGSGEFFTKHDRYVISDNWQVITMINILNNKIESCEVEIKFDRKLKEHEII